MQQLVGLEPQVLLECVEIVFKVGYRVRVGSVVIDAQAASHVDHLKVDASLAIVVEQLVYGLAQHDEWLHGSNLRADVEMQSPQSDVLKCHGVTDDLLKCLKADAEFVVGGACGDVFVSVGVDVGVDPEGDIGFLAHVTGKLVDDVQLRDGFHVEASDALFNAEPDFPIGFSHAREGHLLRVKSGFNGGFNLSSAYQVGPQSMTCYCLEDVRIAIGLNCKVNLERVPVNLSVDLGQRRTQEVHVIIVEWRRRLFRKILYKSVIIQSSADHILVIKYWFCHLLDHYRASNDMSCLSIRVMMRHPGSAGKSIKKTIKKLFIIHKIH